jgi:hypothetical protein
MRLTGKQMILCMAIGTAPAVVSGMPFGYHPVGSVVPYLLAKAIGGSLLSMFVATALNLMARRSASQTGEAPEA